MTSLLLVCFSQALGGNAQRPNLLPQRLHSRQAKDEMSLLTMAASQSDVRSADVALTHHKKLLSGSSGLLSGLCVVTSLHYMQPFSPSSLHTSFSADSCVFSFCNCSAAVSSSCVAVSARSSSICRAKLQQSELRWRCSGCENTARSWHTAATNT